MPSGFKIVEHTADFGLRVWAKQLDELFIESARALTSCIVDMDQIQNVVKQVLHVEAESQEQLLHKMLREILFLQQQNEMVFTEFQVEKSNLNLHGVDTMFMDMLLGGEKVDPQRHNVCREIKAVTYHDFYLKRNGPWWETSFIFDV
jgi:SHS2 domain-containing protein